jgi:hypothetical protein
MATRNSARATNGATNPALTPKGERPEVEGAAQRLRTYEVGRDQSHIASSIKKPPALAFNPAADLETILSLAAGRASVVHELLSAWACADDTESVPASKVADCLVPLAEEVYAIINEACTRVQEEARHG